MKSYDHYTLEDFVQDFYFRQWALSMLDPRDTFWETWCKANPEKQLLIEEACSMVIGLACKTEEIDASEITQAISRIQSRMNTPPFFRRKWFSYAAAVLLPVVTIITVWYFSGKPGPAGGNFEKEAATPGIHWNTNNSSGISIITLTDGSSVSLSPGSRLGTTGQFGRTDRFVWLEGEASFDVTRKTDQPFVVHSHNILTRVLGTVFHVKAYEQDENVSVSVTSGKVTVQKKAEDTPGSNAPPEMVLTPNQQAVISRVNDKIIKTLVESPGVIRQPDHHRHFRFNDTPISEVFHTLEQAYGIPIAYDAEKLSKCNLTARLTEEDLFDKLDLICETIQAGYRITDGQILISGAGCD